MPGLQYEAPSGLMRERWRKYGISEDASHHVYRGRPAYRSRFHEVLKFHEPGLAPVRDASGAYHITHDGRPAYEPRHMRTFGFYEGRMFPSRPWTARFILARRIVVGFFSIP